MQTTVDQIKSILGKHEVSLRAKYGVENVGVFGSVVKGDNTETSDVDMLVEFFKPIGMFKFIELEEYLSKLIGRKVDLVTKKALKEAIKDEILQEVVYV